MAQIITQTEIAPMNSKIGHNKQVKIVAKNAARKILNTLFMTILF